ncbi:MAG: hypothetical protein ACYC91_12160 [Solirubrobacteraceae bacterium]
MVIAPPQAWKLVLAGGLLAAIVIAVFASAPSRSVTRSELGQLVLSAVVLYAVGAIALLTHHSDLAGVVYATGIVVLSVALWLSRGDDSEDPPDGGKPVDAQPPPEPDGLPAIDWRAFERDFGVYAERRSRERTAAP